MSVSKYFMRRPTVLDWNFMERHYPDYYHSNAVLKSDDMSFCLGDMGDIPRDTLITVESYKAFESYAEDLAYRVENGFADYIDSGLTFFQAAECFDDELFAVAILEGEGDILVGDAVRLWARKINDTSFDERKMWYLDRKSSEPVPTPGEQLLIEVANYIALKYGLDFGEDGESVFGVFEHTLQAHLWQDGGLRFSFFLKPDEQGLSMYGNSKFCPLQNILIGNAMPISAAQALIDILISGRDPHTAVSD